MNTPASKQANHITTHTSTENRAAPLHVAIIGGGITGLSAAYYLAKQAREQGLEVTYTLLERADRWGGKVRSERIEGYGDEPFVIEAGPDSFITTKPQALELATELGLEERVLDTNDDRRKTYVVTKGRPVPLPDGVMMIIPTRIMPFALSPLISIPGKLRMGMDFFIPPKTDGEDETLAEFVERRLGHEALDKLAEPLMSGIYNAEADRQSLLATFPRFRDLEVKYGNLIKGMLASRKASGARKAASSGKKRATFASLRSGNQELIETLVDALDGDLRLNAAVQSIDAAGEGYTLTLAGGEQIQADAVILAAPAYAAADLLRPIAPEAADKLDQIRYVSTGTITLAYREDEIGHPLNGFGMVIPRSEKRRINAITWSSTKFDHRAPEGYALIRVFFGGSRTPEMIDKSDEEVYETALAEIEELMGVTATPVMHRIYRWHDSNPQYDVGHLELVEAIEAALPPGISVTGSPYRGIGLPDCIKQAKATTAQIVEGAVEKA